MDIKKRRGIDRAYRRHVDNVSVRNLAPGSIERPLNPPDVEWAKRAMVGPVSLIRYPRLLSVIKRVLILVVADAGLRRDLGRR